MQGLELESGISANVYGSMVVGIRLGRYHVGSWLNTFSEWSPCCAIWVPMCLCSVDLIVVLGNEPLRGSVRKV